VEIPDSIKQVACGQSHILALTDSGDVYSFGNGSMMQLGHGAKTNVRLPRLVLRGKDIHAIATGRYHSMAVTGSGVLYTWGCGESGQLAHSTLDGESFPRLVNAILPNVVGQIACGEHHSFCLACMLPRPQSYRPLLCATRPFIGFTVA
jgi:alpha-tubulin suppressor-like RCC1 family protein